MPAPLLFDRRDLLRFGCVALGGMLLPGRVASATPKPRARACILLYMDGGPSHIDLWDLKPSAPAEIRGPFRPIATSVPGIRVCEHLPRVARQMHLLTQARGVRHTEVIHDPAVYQMLTGRKHLRSAGGLTVQPDDFPHIGSVFSRVDVRPTLMPRAIELPETMRMEARVLPGQNGGFLGANHDPFRVQVTADARVIPPDVRLHENTTPTRLATRSDLLRQFDRRCHALESPSPFGRFDDFRRQALALLGRPRVRQAFDLSCESTRLREGYGMQRHGQSVLLARRLVEAGARFVTVYWGKEPQDWADGRGLRPANNPWDTHRNHFPLLRDALIPRADRALAALVEDLHLRGLLDSTLVVWMGDFGRTPRIDRKYGSRDHWPHANTILFAGAGMPAGAVYGKTDRRAAEVIDGAVSPADVHATILHTLGVDLNAHLHDPQGRPHALTEGTPIQTLVG